MSHQYDPADKEQARKLWYKHRKKKNGQTNSVRHIWKLIVDAAEEGRWDIGENLRKPSENTVKTWIAEDWAPKFIDLPEDEIVQLLDDAGDSAPEKVRVLWVLHELASDLWEKEKNLDHRMEREFPGFPKTVSEWAWRISGFFDLTVQDECMVLLHFAYLFAGEERYKKSFKEPMAMRDENSKMLMRWNRRHQEPDMTQKMLETEGTVSIPIWEQPNARAMEWIVASQLKAGLEVLATIDEGYVDIDVVTKRHAELIGLEVVQPEDLRRIVSEIEEPETTSNVPVGLVVAQPEDIPDVADQIPEQFWPLLEAQGWQRPTKEADGE